MNSPFVNGYTRHLWPLPPEVIKLIEQKNWTALDGYFQTQLKPERALRQLLDSYGSFGNVEFILSLRTAPDDEDGIWHDDGSRKLAFSLGLNLSPEQIEGGELLLKKKDEPESHATRFAPLALGELVVFLTGEYGYEHRVLAVTKGERLVCAGWLS